MWSSLWMPGPNTKPGHDFRAPDFLSGLAVVEFALENLANR
jgi:hypothetical protein